jgi:hypothetical protein
MRWIPLVLSLSLSLAATACSEAEEGDPPPLSLAKLNCKVDRAPASSSSGLQQSSRPIVSGSAAPDAATMKLTKGQFMAIGSIRLVYKGKNILYGSATLIADRLVLTAGHVPLDYDRWDGDPATFSTRLFPTTMVKFVVGNDANNPDKVLDVEKIIINPQFQSHVAVEHDLALLVLKESATKAVPGIETIPVNLALMTPGTAVGKTIFSGGFGSTTCYSQQFSPIRYWAQQTICQVYGYELGHKTVGQGMYTNGDSGAGVFMTCSDGVPRQVSVISAHADPQCKQTQGTRLDAHADWLRTQLKGSCDQLKVTATGSCDGQVAVWCDDGQVVRSNCAARKLTCGTTACGQSRCLAAPAKVEAACKTLDYFGRCTAEGVLEWCVDGKLQQRDCRHLGATCDKSTDPLVGNTCLGEARPDAGMADAGVDVALPDAGTPQTCLQVDACNKAAKDFWDRRKCLASATYKTKKLYRDYYHCQICAITNSAVLCDTTKTSYLSCTSVCSDATSAGCMACLDSACKAEGEACAKN